MKLHASSAVVLLAAALPALSAPTCPAPDVVMGNNCAFSTSLGWIAAGDGTASILTIYVPPNASGPVDFEITALTSSLGSSYTGYFGFMFGQPGVSGTVIVTLSDIIAGAPYAIGPISPGQLTQAELLKVCWDPTCTAAAPAGAVPNMMSLQLVALTPNSSDIAITPNPAIVTQFLNGTQVTFEAQVPAQRADSLYTIFPGINLGATPAVRYVYNGAAVTSPFDAISISNLNNTNPITGTATLQDVNGNTVATAPIPSIAPGGAAGYLVIGRTPGDSLGLFPSTTVLPAGTDGVFHGSLIIGMNGQIATGQCIILGQEYNGNAMLNLTAVHSSLP